MEDKYKPSKEFTDHAWSEMQALLDKEMPDKGAIIISPDQGKRKNLLLLLSLFLLLSVAALFFYYQSNHDLSNDWRAEGKETTELAIIPTEKNADLIDLKGVHLTTESKGTIASSSENSSNSEQVVHSTQKSDLSQVNNATINSKSNTPSSKSYKESLLSKVNSKNAEGFTIIQNAEQSQVATSIKEVQITEEQQILTPFILDEEKYFDVDNKNADETQKDENPTVALLSPIDAKALHLLTLEEEEQNIDDFLDVKKIKNKSALYAFVGARNYDLASKIDFVGGIETVIRKKDKKLGLRTGFNYAQRSTIYLTREERIAEVSIDEADTEFGMGGLNPSGTFYDLRAELNANPVKYHFLEVPLFLDYKLSKKWSLHAGIAAKTLLYSSVQDFGLANGLSLRSQDDEAAPTTNSLEERNSISYFSPSKLNLGTSLGVNFIATERLGLQARFSHNLLDVYPQLPNNQRSSSLELGVSWRLK